MISPLFNMVASGWFACWGIGAVLMACGFAMYIVKFWGREIANEMRADRLPVASRLIYFGAGLGVIGAVLGFIGIMLVLQH